MDRDDAIYRKPLHELHLTELAELCGNVARHLSANPKQWDMVHALRVEWVGLCLDHSLDGGKKEAKEAEVSLKKRMGEFLAEIPTWS
jgi:hypothetical protein